MTVGKVGRPGAVLSPLGTICIRVDEQAQLFNSIDPSPFHRRDLDTDCEEFVMAWAREFDDREPLRIVIQFDEIFPGEPERIAIAGAVPAFFARAVDLQNLRVRRLLREGRWSLLVGLAFLAVCTGGATLLPVATMGTLGHVVAEGLIIAGWVAMWHPLEVLLYGIWPVFRERRLLRRLAAADVQLLDGSD